MRLYRILLQHRYNGGAGSDVLQSEECIYCGYDRAEALRVYHQSRPGDSRNASPGAYYTVTVCQSKRLSKAEDQ